MTSTTERPESVHAERSPPASMSKVRQSRDPTYAALCNGVLPTCEIQR